MPAPSSAACAPCCNWRASLLCSERGPFSNCNLARPSATEQRRVRIFHPFLLWFLPPRLWSGTSSPDPFHPSPPSTSSNISRGSRTLPRRRHLFPVAQLLQFTSVLLAPLLYRKWGRIVGISLAQFCTAIALVCMAAARKPFVCGRLLLRLQRCAVDRPAPGSTVFSWTIFPTRSAVPHRRSPEPLWSHLPGSYCRDHRLLHRALRLSQRAPGKCRGCDHCSGPLRRSSLLCHEKIDPRWPHSKPRSVSPLSECIPPNDKSMTFA